MIQARNSREVIIVFENGLTMWTGPLSYDTDILMVTFMSPFLQFMKLEPILFDFFKKPVMDQ